MTNIIIRKGRREDCKAIRDLSKELADTEKMPDGPEIDEKVLEKDGFDSEHPLFVSFVAVANDKVVGYALYFYSYSTWKGKAMYLEDLCVTSEYRNQGVGSKLLKAVAKEAIETGCCRIDFIVLNWNPAQEFYKNKGAIDLSAKDGWLQFRFNKDALINFANSPDTL